ncbi:putative GEM-like protein 8 [Hibiscus syriacus]|uniref:GEM-like protein 8 n=1 Tax=Hibiscus syriacus TaxID=106335 RepID=A0A6A3A2E9_HIBSY|nr:putative GEM-like protein 8 [Hibiscus syriacus]
MKIRMPDQVIGVPMKSSAYQIEEHRDATYRMLLASIEFHHLLKGLTHLEKVGKGNFVLKRMNKLGKKADTFAHGIREHVRLGPKITETVKGKLSLGARILQVGGPLAGLLFVSSQKVAFCSDRSIKIPSPNGEFLRVHYKVLIPIEKIKGVNESENMKKPSQKYMEIVTVDDFEFWFMGFLNYQKALKYLQQAISQRLCMMYYKSLSRWLATA